MFTAKSPVIFTYFPGVEILWKGTVSAQAIRPTLCGNCAFPQNFQTRKLGENYGIFQSVCLKQVTINMTGPQ